MTPLSDAELNRREFVSLASILAGGVALGDLLSAPPAVRSAAESLEVGFDYVAWCENLTDEAYFDEPVNPFTQFLDQAGAVFRAGPQLRVLTLNNLNSAVHGLRLDVRRLAACPQLAQLHTLNLLKCYLELDDLRVLGNSRHLSGLQRLVIWHDSIGDDGLRALAATPLVSNLRSLSLNLNRIGPVGAQVLAACPRLGRLEELDVYSNPIGNEGARALAESRCLPALKRLWLVENDIGPEGARALAAAPQLSRLGGLGLAHQAVGPDGARVLTARFGDAVWVEDDRATDRALAEADHKSAVAARPSDDGPRLAYADWLAGSDPDRAEFIRLQISTAGRPEYDGVRREQEALCSNLIAAHGRAWLERLNFHAHAVRGRDPGESYRVFMHHLDHSRAGFPLRRGLAEGVATNARGFVRNAGLLWQEAPWMCEAQVTLGVDPPEWDRHLARSPHLARLTDLELRRVGPGVLRLLAASPHLSRLTTLRVAESELDAGALVALLSPARLPHLAHLSLSGCSGEVLGHLAASGHLTRLASLRVSDSEVDPETVSRIFQPGWAALRSLDLTDTYLGDSGARALAAAPTLAGVRSLNLTGTGLTGRGAAELAASPHLAGLEALTLWRTDVGSEGTVSLAASPNFSGLKLLNLAEVGLDPDGAAAVAASPHLAGLRLLDLGDNPLGDEGAIAVGSSGTLRHLEILEVNNTGVTAEGAGALGRSRVLSGVVTLYLSNNPLGDAGVAALATSEYLGKLRYLAATAVGCRSGGAAALAAARAVPKLSVLRLNNNAVGDDGAAALAGAALRTGLRVLGLAGAEIGDEGARALARSEPLSGLIGLEVRHNPISDEAVALLSERFGGRVRAKYWSPAVGSPPL